MKPIVMTNSNAPLFIKKLELTNQKYFVKEYESVTYVKYGECVYSFPKNNGFSKGLYLFGMVKKDFDNWLEKNQDPKFEEQYMPIRTFKTIIDERKIYAYDISHAYWRIAFLNGYISENTYNHGLKLKDSQEAPLKKLYSMALSVQGQSKFLDGMEGSKKTGKRFEIPKNPIHRNIYNDIKNRTHQIMDSAAFLIRSDVISYNVDCIRFQNKKNCKIIENYLTSQKLTFKQI